MDTSQLYRQKPCRASIANRFHAFVKSLLLLLFAVAAKLLRRGRRSRPDFLNIANIMLALHPVVSCSATDALPTSQLLARFRLSGPAEAGDQHLPAAVLACEGMTAEYWFAREPLEPARLRDAEILAGETVGFASLLFEGDDLRAAGRAIYEQIATLQQALALPQVLRIWHYLPAINEGEGDNERYRQFSTGRCEGMERHPMQGWPLPAATAVGSDEDMVQVHVLMCREKLIGIENPRQVSAFRYPRQYGPRSPAFARAARVEQGQLLVSGTASIVGHETLHQGDAVAQTQESIANIEALIDSAWTEHATGEKLQRLEFIRVYLRYAAHLEPVQRALEQILPPGVPRVFIRADLCRADLLVEVEAGVNPP